MNALDYLATCTVLVWPGQYSILKANQFEEDCFACIKDNNEITVIKLSEKVNASNFIEEEKNWRILTFQVVLPFELTGFLAEVAKVLADRAIPIFAISAYSTDHILIKEEYLNSGLEALKSLGSTIVISDNK